MTKRITVDLIDRGFIVSDDKLGESYACSTLKELHETIEDIIEDEQKDDPDMVGPAPTVIATDWPI